MSDIQFTLATFMMALGGFLIHFLGSWGEFWRAKDTAKVGLIVYVGLDPPAWIAALVGAVAAYFTLPELGEALGSTVPIRLSPLWSLMAGYVGSSMAPKLLGLFAARAGVR